MTLTVENGRVVEASHPDEGVFIGMTEERAIAHISSIAQVSEYAARLIYATLIGESIDDCITVEDTPREEHSF